MIKRKGTIQGFEGRNPFGSQVDFFILYGGDTMRTYTVSRNPFGSQVDFFDRDTLLGLV